MDLRQRTVAAAEQGVMTYDEIAESFYASFSKDN